MSITTNKKLLGVARLEPSRKQSMIFVNIFQSLGKTADTSQHGSEEFDTEGAMFQEQESIGKIKGTKEVPMKPNILAILTFVQSL